MRDDFGKKVIYQPLIYPSRPLPSRNPADITNTCLCRYSQSLYHHFPAKSFQGLNFGDSPYLGNFTPVIYKVCQRLGQQLQDPRREPDRKRRESRSEPTNTPLACSRVAFGPEPGHSTLG